MPEPRVRELNLRAWLLTRRDGEAPLAAALGSDADVVILGLGEASAFARESRADKPARPRIAAKIGDALEDDLDAVMPIAPWAILASCRSGADVQRVAAKLAVREARLGLVDGATRIVACVSAPMGVLHLASFAGASPRLAALTFDARSLREHLSAPRASVAPLLARGLIAMAAAAADVAAIDSLADPGDARAEAESARREGFSGKIAGSRQDVAVIQEVFAGRT